MPGITDEKIIRDADLIGTLAEATRLAADGIVACMAGRLSEDEARDFTRLDERLEAQLGEYSRKARAILRPGNRK